MKISPTEALRAILSGGQFRSPQQIARLGRIVSSGLSAEADSSEVDGLKAQLVEAQDELAGVRAELADLTAAHAKCTEEIAALKAAATVKPAPAAEPKTTRRTRKKSTPSKAEDSE